MNEYTKLFEVMALLYDNLMLTSESVAKVSAMIDFATDQMKHFLMDTQNISS